ncbi:hypothetical protein HID58_048781, partial [Brassica napus]
SNERERDHTEKAEEEDMAEARLLDMSRVFHSSQRYGPKGFMEIKILENDNLYVRVDLPGVPDDGVRHRVDSVRQKVVFFSGEETLGGDGDKKNAREYSGTAGSKSKTMTTGTLFLPPNAGSKPSSLSKVKKITPFGVCGDDMLVLPNENEVKFYGENKDVCEHDESCRIFMGAIKGSSFCAPGVPLLSHDIAWDAEFGVLKVRVSPPGSNISSE